MIISNISSEVAGPMVTKFHVKSFKFQVIEYVRPQERHVKNYSIKQYIQIQVMAIHMN